MNAAAPNLAVEWQAAVAHFRTLEIASRATHMDADEADQRVEAMCQAMDALIEHRRAPSVSALAYKVGLAQERAGGFEDVLFSGHARGIIEDIKLLALRSGDTVDPHAGWLADRNRILAITDRWAPMADGLMSELTDLCCDLERRIRDTPATSSEGWAAKAAAAIQLATEGFELNEDFAAALLQEAVALMGISRGGDAQPAMAQAA